jgi:hypothetical protein
MSKTCWHTYIRYQIISALLFYNHITLSTHTALMKSVCSKAPHLCHNQNGSWLGYRLDGLGFKSWQGKEVFIFSTTLELALRPTQPCLQLVLGFFLGEMGVIQPACENDHSPLSSSEVKNEWSYNSPPPVYPQDTDRDKFTPFLKPLSSYAIIFMVAVSFVNAYRMYPHLAI